MDARNKTDVRGMKIKEITDLLNEARVGAVLTLFYGNKGCLRMYGEAVIEKNTDKGSPPKLIEVCCPNCSLIKTRQGWVLEEGDSRGRTHKLQSVVVYNGSCVRR